jgi:hypothetical protein
MPAVRSTPLSAPPPDCDDYDAVSRSSSGSRTDEEGQLPLQPPRPLNPSLPLNQQVAVDPRQSRFPYAIVWGPLPLLSWLIPCAGHLGIADSEGVVHDFAGPYYVETDRFMVTPVRYYQLTPEEIDMSVGMGGRAAVTPEERRRLWDSSIHAGDTDFRSKMHNILLNNCHHHVERCFQHMGVRMSAWRALWLVMTRGKFVDRTAAACFFLPTAFIIMIVVLIAVFA